MESLVGLHNVVCRDVRSVSLGINDDDVARPVHLERELLALDRHEQFYAATTLVDRVINFATV